MRFLKRLFKKKLTYTEIMREQDALWENGNEDLALQAQLFHDIVKQAKKKGFSGEVYIYTVADDSETIAEVFDSQEEAEGARLGHVNDYDTSSTCRGLIEHLEKRLNA